MQKLSLLIISGNPAVRRGLVSLFMSQGTFNVVGDIEATADVENLQHLQPDLALLGFCYDQKDISSIIKNLKEVCPCTLVIFLSDLKDYSHIKTAFLAGADGCLKTPILPSDLVTAAELSCRSGICFLPKEAKDTILDLKGGAKTHLTIVKENSHGPANIDQ